MYFLKLLIKFNYNDFQKRFLCFGKPQMTNFMGMVHTVLMKEKYIPILKMSITPKYVGTVYINYKFCPMCLVFNSMFGCISIYSFMT